METGWNYKYGNVIDSYFTTHQGAIHVTVKQYVLNTESIRKLSSSVKGVVVLVYAHGHKEGALVDKKRRRNGTLEKTFLSSDKIIELIKATKIDIALIHLGFCESLPPQNSVAMQVVMSAAGDTPFSGYFNEAIYGESSALELLYLDQIILEDKHACAAFEFASKKCRAIVKNTGLWCYEKEPEQKK
jgi:hypothetical protein